jgi:hypothetical protein
MAFGIDTFRSHLDLINYTEFLIWNGATLEEGESVSGTPLFAGRNFLGDDFIWGHAEATNASSEPLTVGQDGRAHYPLPVEDPSPEHPENLTLFVDRIAPIQAPLTARQQLVGDKGRLFGRIDADAICRRLKACILSGEFRLGESDVFVWLSVDPKVNFSADYWAGWADTVNNFTIPIFSQTGALIAQLQRFSACVLCGYAASPGGRLIPDPNVTTALNRANRGLNTAAHARWADFQVWESAPADLLANGNPLFDFDRFDPPTAPLLWRFAKGFLKPDGTPADVAFDLDAINPASDLGEFMLEVQKWQPNVPSIQNLGFSNSGAITIAQTACLQTTDLPDLNDNNFRANSGHFHVPGGHVNVIGRYIRPTADSSMSAPEAQRLSNADMSLFTIWEGARLLARMGLSESSEEDTDKRKVEDWGEFTANIHKNIFYFNPDPDGSPATHDDAGTLDGKDAFHYCGVVLKQPPQTPVFFAIDFDPYDLPDPRHPPHPAGTVEPPAPPGWPALPSINVREQWIKSYFQNIKTARDEFATQTGRHYLIGVYCAGKTLQLLYEQGIASHFWQSGSGRNGNRPPNWPWYHANRWQYRGNLEPKFCAIGKIDPDADWGDGGTWSLTDPLSLALIELELLEHFRILDDPSVLLADLEP